MTALRSYLIFGAVFAIIGIGTMFVFKVDRLETANLALRSEVATVSAERDNLLDAVAAIKLNHSLQLAKIAKLSAEAKINRQTVAPFLIRIDDLAIKDIPDANTPQVPFVDRLNGLNSDVNRLLEQTTR